MAPTVRNPDGTFEEWKSHEREPRGCPTPGACSAAEIISELEKERDRLTSENDELWRDRERLDFLSNNGMNAGNRNGEYHEVWYAGTRGVKRLSVKDDIRDAIDEAMRSDKS